MKSSWKREAYRQKGLLLIRDLNAGIKVEHRREFLYLRPNRPELLFDILKL